MVMGELTQETELLVIGSGPGGYAAAFRAADLGLEVILIERYPSLGGVCLNVGCIPSKALLHVAKVISESDESAEIGITFSSPKIDVEQVLTWKNGIVKKLTRGLAGLASKRKVRVVNGSGEFVSPHMIRLDNGETVWKSRPPGAAVLQKAHDCGLCPWRFCRSFSRRSLIVDLKCGKVL